MESQAEIIWTDYMRHRTALRGFDLAKIEHIVRHSTERYFDGATGRVVIVGQHDETLVIIPCEANKN